MNKKKILVLAMTLSMVAILAIGGTMAYFTDADFNKNVMTTGNVKIDQIENERNEESKLVDFTDGHKLAPYTGTVGADGKANAYGAPVTVNGVEYEMFDQSKNAIDKIVTVTNKGTEECYVRTLFAWEMINVDGKWVLPIHNSKYLVTSAQKGLNGMGMPTWTYDADNEFGLDVKKGDYVTFDLDGVKYAVSCYYYQNESKLAGKIDNEDGTVTYATTHPSLKQIYLNANVGNEWYDLVGEEYNILVLSQATQTEGFTSAKEALNAAFGEYYEVGADTLKKWFSTTESKELSKD